MQRVAPFKSANNPGNNTDIDKKEVWHLVKCGSVSLTDCQCRYATCELECLAIAINFAQYANKHFLIMVDRASSCAFCEETKGQTMVETVRILRRWFDEFGYLNIVRAVDGPSFRTCLDCWLEENNVTRQKSAAYNS